MKQSQKQSMPAPKNAFRKEKRYRDYRKLFMIGLWIVIVCGLLLILMEIF